MGTRTKYTLKLITGAIIVGAIIYLGYWLLFDYQVRNTFALIAIGIFIIIPGIKVLLVLPNELKILYLIWTSDNPEMVEKIAGDLRERDQL